MKIAFLLYKYELKKIFSQKVLWATLLIFTLLTIGVGISPILSSNFEAGIKAKKELSGRYIDDVLLSEYFDGNKKEGFGVIGDFIRFSLRKNEFEKIDEKTLYEERISNNLADMKKDNLGGGEVGYWLDKEKEVKKPFLYQYDEGYAAFFSVIYVINYMLLILNAMAVGGIFADEKAKGMDNLIFSTPLGKKKLYGIKILTGITFSLFSGFVLLLSLNILNFSIYGFEGYNTPIQIRIPGCMMDLSIGKAVLIMEGLIIIISVLYSMVAAFLSMALKNHAAVNSVMVVGLFLSMINLPSKLGVISHIWKMLPGTFVGSWSFAQYRLIYVFGKYFNYLQAVPVIYIAACIALIFVAKRGYDNYEVTGK